MENHNFISLLRHKRHDWMNQIQLLQGYATLGKQDKLLEQIDELKAEAEQEHRLLNSKADTFSLWLLSFNSSHSQYRLVFYIKDEVDLSRHDLTITAYSRRMIELMEEHNVEGELYEGTLHIYNSGNNEAPGLSWEWEGAFRDLPELQKKLSKEGFIVSIFEGRELSVEMMID
ncbi:Spo0B domain-containing protein [Halobacillus salinarum]|uniref:Spo0B domain-containing protein n=1 Tax=Halobacillus salinarum TaxID=2932257 RepID=A0ABY4ERH9_9BACI|nr:Spo0B domain-containing protein [Halobacillus salinarum]UOQ46259.1 Spo0B domain-containing protein [Halobacillus salinarum]